MINLLHKNITIHPLPEDERPYHFLGAIPQLVGEHFEVGEERKTLVNLKDY